jgi:uncharacterized protein involved in exopolysaccharide biosynthesis
MRSTRLLLALFVAAGFGPLGTACHDDESPAARRASAQATAQAEERAQEATLTSATLEPRDDAEQVSDEALRAKSEMLTAFRLEQADYRGRLQRSLDQLDGEVLHARGARRSDGRIHDLRARRDLLKADLQAVDRSTEPDWATLRTKVERDLDRGRPGAQLAPRTDRTPGEPR